MKKLRLVFFLIFCLFLFFIVKNSFLSQKTFSYLNKKKKKESPHFKPYSSNQVPRKYFFRDSQLNPNLLKSNLDDFLQTYYQNQKKNIFFFKSQ
jgi:hypothetical protein